MLRHYNRDISGSLVDLSEFTPRIFTAQSKAEEGAVGSWTVTLDDPDSDLDILGHSNWFIEDDESEDEDDIIFGGFVGSVSFARYEGSDRRMYGPLARVVVVEIVDANTFLSRQIMKGSDTNRPIETDVERMEWLLGTDEASILTDVSTYVSTASPINMDKAPLRGTYFGQIVTDCGQASGKNFYAWYRKVAGIRTLTMWYGRDGLSGYESPFFITNDPADIDEDLIDNGTATVWKLSDDARMRRITERQYCGNYLTYEGGAVYRHNATTHDLITTVAQHHRDMASNVSLVKTKTKAQARADRQLLDVQDPEIRITTTLTGVPQERVTLAKAGMRLEVKGTHYGPDCDAWHYARIVSAQPRPFGPGRTWDIDLELVLGAESDGPPPPPFTGDVFAGLQRSNTHNMTYGTLVFQNSYNTGEAAPGWDVQEETGPITVDQSAYPYTSMTVSAPMTVRIYTKAHAAGIAIPGVSRSMYVRINGVTVDTITHFLNGVVNQDYISDLRDYELADGDVVSIYSEGSVFWTNTGINTTQMVIVRGDFLATTGFDGP